MSSEENWEQLRKHYRERGLALALGAGVSIGCHLPGWCELLERIAEKCLGGDGKAIVGEMIKEGFTLPAVAGILEAECPDGVEFAEVVRDSLYRDFRYYKRKKVSRLPDFVDFVKETNPTLCAVAALCAIKKGPDSYITNPRVHAIANSNFDSLLRAYSSSRHAPHILRTIERPSAGSVPERINVYHVHGYFQFDSHYIGNPTKEALDIRVFTEHDYFNFFNQPNGLFNYTFLYLLREYRVLFVGMSLKDDNVRRLLHYSRKEIRESYEKEGEASKVAEKKSLRHYAIQQRSKKSRHVDKIIETSLGRLGVHTLWIDDFGEVGARLKDLYESTGAKWRDVY